MLNYSESTHFLKDQVVPDWFKKDELDLPRFNSLLTENTEQGPEAVLNNSKYNPLLTPFELEWIYGFDVSVQVLNLCSEEKREIFYSATNVGILYDYCAKTMRLLKGHKSRIVSVSVDKTGRWLATADNSSENVIMIWDTKSANTVWTIYNHPPSGYQLTLIAISLNARMLITVSDESTNSIHFWLWTFGKESPDDTYTDDRNLGSAKAIKFHPNNKDHIMVVFERTILLFHWNNERRNLYRTTNPKCPLGGSTGYYTDGTYVDHCHECFVSTTRGCILVFGNSIFTKNYVKEELDNEKFYIKTIRTSKDTINCIESVDKLIITCDSAGYIMFFDSRLQLLFWYSKHIKKPIKSISFDLTPRKYELVSIKDYEKEEIDEYVIPNCIVDRTLEYEKLFLEVVPKDVTLKKFPFVTRDFFLTTEDGTIYVMNFTTQEFKPIFPTVDSSVNAIAVHDEKPYMIIAYAKGRLILYNYETHQEILQSNVPQPDPEATVSTIKFSHQCLHLACGKSNGEMWLLQPATLAQIYVDPFKFGNDKILKIAFSKNSLQMAYYDANMTVYAFVYDTDSEDWIFKGKVRSHYKEIRNILFLDEDPYGLFSVGKDRHLIKYTNLSTNDEELDIYTRDRIEQKDIPLYFIAYPRKKYSRSGYFLIADDKHKYKTISSRTGMCTAVYLGPSYGCYRDSPVQKMKFLPQSDKRYLIFMNKKHIGIQLMPIDGNPYKFVGYLGHPEELLDFKLSYDGRYIFTIGVNDRSVSKLRIKTTSVETMHIIGGLELQPYYCLIEGGREGFLFQEMRDLFYYMQILQQGEHICISRSISDTINIGELPDLMRACGYYPSEYEIENLLTDLRYKDFDDSRTLKDKVTFCEFVKLFINHKPAYGYTIESLEDAFENVTTFSDEYGATDMPRDDFIEAITTTGEQVSSEQIYRCLTTLLHVDIMVQEEQFGERDFDFMPDSIDFDYFTEDILGVDMNTVERVGRDDDDEDNNRGYYYYR